MKVTRTSKLSGITRTMDLNITVQQYQEWQHGKLIQDAFPQLSASEREFISTGSTDEEWNELFGDE